MFLENMFMNIIFLIDIFFIFRIETIIRKQIMYFMIKITIFLILLLFHEI